MEKKFHEEIDSKSEEIDPSEKEDWYSLTIGWAIGHGFDPEDSIAIATHIRYHTKMG
jgi:hypothetical protein